VPLAPARGTRPGAAGRPRVGVIGAGQFARLTILPALRQSGADLAAIASRRGLAAVDLGRKFGFLRACSRAADILDDPDIDTVFIVTRHDSHARLVAQALEKGKHVFVEKPLAIHPAELDALAATRAAYPAPLVTVGFNRDHAPLVRRMRETLRGRMGPAALVATVNAGAIPADHWLLDPEVGGGRLVGEGCHWIELMVSLAGVPVRSVAAVSTGGDRGSLDPSVSVTLGFADGSIGTLHYLTRGHRRFAKERLEVFYDGRVLSLDNFRSLTIFGGGGAGRTRTWRQDKGHMAEVRDFLAAVSRGGPAPIPWKRLAHVTRVGFCALEALRTGQPVLLADDLAGAEERA
jgi:predicted dehydrogenase